MRDSAPFTIFYRTSTGDGGYACQTCGNRRHDTFPRAADVFAVAAQHLNVCRAALSHRPVEGEAILDGAKRGVVLRDGIMVLSMETVFHSVPGAARVVA
jgi:hypothetical protein